jgi:hypothetical protein
VRSDEFSLFEKGKLLINDASFQNQIIIIDRQEICVRIKSLDVRFLDIIDSEIVGQSIVSSKEEYIFSIDKDIAIPFEKDELLDYYNNRKKRIAISAVIEYGSKKDRIGIGMLNKEK